MVCTLDSVAERANALGCCIEVIRNATYRDTIKGAVKCIHGELLRQFPPGRFETNATENLLEAQLPAKLRERNAVVVAFVEKEAIDQSLWSWAVHLVEITGVGAKIDSMVATARFAAFGVWKSRPELKEPLVIPPFGSARHIWRILCPPGDATIRLSYSGYSQGEPGGPVVVLCPEQYPG